MSTPVTTVALALTAALTAGCSDGATVAVDAGADAPPAGPWRSALYPADWTPAFTAPDGGFLHDMSYAGYRRSEAPLPTTWPGIVVDVTAHGADPTGVRDSAPAFAAAIAAVEAAGGGTVLVPDGGYRLAANLTVRGAGVLIRGASRAGARLRFTATGTGGQASITFAGAPPAAARVALVEDAVPRATSIRVADPGGLRVGAHVVVDQLITQAFIDELGMGGLWDITPNSALGLRKIFLRREIVALAGDVVTLDVPIRSRLRVRDGAALGHDDAALHDCGVASLSINTAVDAPLAAGNPRAHAIELLRVRDCFVRDVTSVAWPDGPGGAAHLQSGGVYVVESKRVTVADTVMAHAQNHGNGGAGYGFEASASSDVLFRDCRAEDLRHGLIQNWDFGSSGLVWLRCASIDNTVVGDVTGPGRSEFHHRLAVACLFDSTRDTAGFNAYNRGIESSNAGLTASENVFWNVAGSGVDTSAVVSFQAGRGYVIGTHDLATRVVPDAITEAVGLSAHAEPDDWVEGEGRGAELEPASLFEDQLARRLRR